VFFSHNKSASVVFPASRAGLLTVKTDGEISRPAYWGLDAWLPLFFLDGADAYFDLEIFGHLFLDGTNMKVMENDVVTPRPSKGLTYLISR